MLYDFRVVGEEVHHLDRRFEMVEVVSEEAHARQTEDHDNPVAANDERSQDVPEALDARRVQVESLAAMFFRILLRRIEVKERRKVQEEEEEGPDCGVESEFRNRHESSGEEGAEPDRGGKLREEARGEGVSHGAFGGAG